jgi:hypothetical protein
VPRDAFAPVEFSLPFGKAGAHLLDERAMFGVKDRSVLSRGRSEWLGATIGKRGEAGRRRVATIIELEVSPSPPRPRSRPCALRAGRLGKNCQDCQIDTFDKS